MSNSIWSHTNLVFLKLVTQQIFKNTYLWALFPDYDSVSLHGEESNNL